MHLRPMGRMVDLTAISTAYRITSSHIYALEISMYAPDTNGGIVYVGGSDVAAERCYMLDVNESLTLRGEVNCPIDLSHLWFATSNAGDDVHCIWTEIRQ